MRVGTAKKAVEILSSVGKMLMSNREEWFERARSQVGFVELHVKQRWFSNSSINAARGPYSPSSLKYRASSETGI